MFEVAIIILALPVIASFIVFIVGGIDLYKRTKHCRESLDKYIGVVHLDEPYPDDTPITLKGEKYVCMVYVDGKRLGMLPKYKYGKDSWELYGSLVFSQEELEKYREKFKTFGDIREYTKKYVGPFDEDKKVGYFE